jgi:iron complex outermembrane receptor protein/vitamin B12 transporter
MEIDRAEEKPIKTNHEEHEGHEDYFLASCSSRLTFPRRREMRLMARFTIVSLWMVLLGISFSAQGKPGVVRGTVVDASGAAVKQARVVLRSLSGFVIRESVTNERGAFIFDNLSAGDYRLSVVADGLTQAGGAQTVKVADGQESSVSVSLTIGAIKDAVIVSATRTEASASEASASAYVVSASDLLRSQRVSALDALRSAPGVAIVQTARRGGITSLFVRGGESDYTKVLIDGLPVNDAGGAFDLADLTTENIARLELVRGAQSALYGSDAVSGVLQVITQRGTSATPELEIAAEGGSFAFHRERARFSGTRDWFNYSLSFAHLRTNGRGRNDDYQNRTASLNFGFRLSDRTQLRWTARNENAGLGTPGPTAALFPDPDQRSRHRRTAIGLRLDDQTTRFWHQSVSFVYAESNQLSFDPAAQDLTKPNTPPDTTFAFNDFVSLFNNHQRRRGLRYQSDLALPFGNLLSTGVDYEHERAVFDNGFAGQNRVAPDRTNVGVFLQNQFSYASRLILTAGLRVEHNRAEMPANLQQILGSLGSTKFDGRPGFGTKVAPKVSAMLLAWHGQSQGAVGATKLRANYGEGIKEPSLVEAFSPNQFFLGNPALRPERSRSFDLGLEQLLWRERLRVEATYFENRFRDQIAFVGNPATFGGPITTADGRLTHFINHDRARARGLEISAAARPSRHLSFSGHYTLLDSKLLAAADLIDFNAFPPVLVPNREVGLPLLRRPRHSGAINVTWVGERFDLNLDAIFVGRRRDGDPVRFSPFDAQGLPIYNPGYEKLDLSGSYHLTPRLTAFARIENLLNQNYQEALGFPAYRLNFSAGLRFRIGGER